MRAMMAFAWPGNVRQLENAVERAVTLGQGRKQIELADLPPEVSAIQTTAVAPFVDLPEVGLDMPVYIAGIQRGLIGKALERTGGNKNQAAELLRIKRTTLVEMLKRLEGRGH
jgi:transcriptional regulator with PAS, ATPase and Fis domain